MGHGWFPEIAGLLLNLTLKFSEGLNMINPNSAMIIKQLLFEKVGIMDGWNAYYEVTHSMSMMKYQSYKWSQSSPLCPSLMVYNYLNDDFPRTELF